jgi:trk system potassium uptake protein
MDRRLGVRRDPDARERTLHRALGAYFEAVSALTTTGMSVIHDLDHLETSMGLYRHLLQIAGGLGIIIVILALFSAGGSRVGTLYVSEARDERILPNVLRTSRFIAASRSRSSSRAWSCWSRCSSLPASHPCGRLEHALALFLSSFSTGGFSLMQSSVAYYHSAAVELVVMLLMFAGHALLRAPPSLWSGTCASSSTTSRHGRSRSRQRTRPALSLGSCARARTAT